MPFSVGMPSTGASHSSRFIFSKAACVFSVPLEVLSCVAHQLLHGVHFVCVSFNELTVVIGKPQEAHELCVCSGSKPSSPILPFKYSISDKTGFLDSNSYDEGLPENLSSSTSRHQFRTSLKTVF